MHRMLSLALKKVSIVRNTPCQTPTTPKNMPPAKFLIASIKEMPLPLVSFQKTLNCPFALKEDFFRKLTNISFCLFVVFHHAKVFHKKFLEQIMRYKVA